MNFPHRIIDADRYFSNAGAALLGALDLAGLGTPFHWAGEIGICERAPRVAIVGTRTPGSDSEAVIEGLAGELARQGSVVVSGAALGTDMAAHRGALDNGGATIACVPQGLATLDWRRWRREFASCASPELILLLAPFARRQPITRQTPIVRNRLIAALAEVVVAGEAGVSSGTMWCLRAAQEFGVPVFFCAQRREPDEQLALLHRQLEKRGGRRFTRDEACGRALAGEILRSAARHRRQWAAVRAAQAELFGQSQPE